MTGYRGPRSTLPLGVAILAILIGLFGLLLLVGGILIITAGLVFAGFHIFGTGFIGGLLLVLFAVLLFVVAVGLWNRELWALALSIIVVGILWLSDVANGGVFSLGGVILLLLLVYLILVRHHFT